MWIHTLNWWTETRTSPFKNAGNWSRTMLRWQKPESWWQNNCNRHYLASYVPIIASNYCLILLATSLLIFMYLYSEYCTELPWRGLQHCSQNVGNDDILMRNSVLELKKLYTSFPSIFHKDAYLGISYFSNCKCTFLCETSLHHSPKYKWAFSYLARCISFQCMYIVFRQHFEYACYSEEISDLFLICNTMVLS